MSRLKRRKIKSKPSYNPWETTFELEIEKIATSEGFSSIKTFVYHYINKGFSFISFHKYIKEKYGFIVDRETFRIKIKAFAPSTYNVHTVGYYKRRAEATKKGCLRSVNYFIRNALLKGFGKGEIARSLKTNSSTLKRNKHLHPIDIDGLFPDKVKLGMKDFKSYFRWLKIARKIGFESVVEAIEYLLIEKEMSMRDVAWVFKVTGWRMRVRIARCEYLSEKLNLYRKEKQNGNKANSGTNV